MCDAAGMYLSVWCREGGEEAGVGELLSCLGTESLGCLQPGLQQGALYTRDVLSAGYPPGHVCQRWALWGERLYKCFDAPAGRGKRREPRVRAETGMGLWLALLPALLGLPGRLGKGATGTGVGMRGIMDH